MTIVTQDGRKLEVAKGDGVEFEAGTYIGCDVVYYVDARFRSCRNGFIRHIDIRLGEYTDHLKTAQYVKENLEESLMSGRKFVNMSAYPSAPKDDLMQSLKIVDDYYKSKLNSKGYYLEVGMVNGKTNSRYGFNPDESGSYANAVAKYKISEPKVA